MHRHEIKDEDWDRIKDMLPGQSGDPGVTAKDNRLFINAVLWIAKTGAPWRDLPKRLGPCGPVWKRFDRWAQKGVWERGFGRDDIDQRVPVARLDRTTGGSGECKFVKFWRTAEHLRVGPGTHDLQLIDIGGAPADTDR